MMDDIKMFVLEENIAWVSDLTGMSREECIADFKAYMEELPLEEKLELILRGLEHARADERTHGYFDER